ncbi:MAG: hypothetical protein HY400_01305, partial [Elusimicrobia bacterium]|nr:hypothetical protein [Elusimicrobiota bacterium]
MSFVLLVVSPGTGFYEVLGQVYRSGEVPSASNVVAPFTGYASNSFSPPLALEFLHGTKWSSQRLFLVEDRSRVAKDLPVAPVAERRLLRRGTTGGFPVGFGGQGQTLDRTRSIHNEDPIPNNFGQDPITRVVRKTVSIARALGVFGF